MTNSVRNGDFIITATRDFPYELMKAHIASHSTFSGVVAQGIGAEFFHMTAHGKNNSSEKRLFHGGDIKHYDIAQIINLGKDSFRVKGYTIRCSAEFPTYVSDDEMAQFLVDNTLLTGRRQVYGPRTSIIPRKFGLDVEYTGKTEPYDFANRIVTNWQSPQVLEFVTLLHKFRQGDPNYWHHLEPTKKFYDEFPPALAGMTGKIEGGRQRGGLDLLIANAAEQGLAGQLSHLKMTFEGHGLDLNKIGYHQLPAPLL